MEDSVRESRSPSVAARVIGRCLREECVVVRDYGSLER